VRSVEDPKSQNLRANAAGLGTGETDAEPTQHVQTINDVIKQLKNADATLKIPEHTTMKFAPNDIKGLTFLHETADRQKVRAEVVQKIDDLNAQNHKDIMLLLTLGDDDAEQLMTYTKLCNQIDMMMRADAEKKESEEAFCFFQDIIAHNGPMTARSNNWKGSTWNVQV
jgi:hypothetical protein